MSKKLLIVESPSKAKTIQEYLGKDFEVIASKGHVRQLSSESGSVQIKDGLSFTWDTAQDKMKEIYKKLSDKTEVILATDMDREGEAIAYHLKNLIDQYLSDKKKSTIPISRIFFFEITKKAIWKALESPRDIDKDLVHAYLARIALDYSVGYGLSPQLWKKLKALGKNQSAGRVQSSVLKMMAQKEKEILEFKKEKFYSVEVIFSPGKIAATLIAYKNKKIDPKDKELLEKLQFPKSWEVKDVKQKKVNIHTPAPFITSSLQQEAANRLGMKIENIMKIAQSLYEGIDINKNRKALITYMRTDSTNISKEALSSIRNFIKEQYPNLVCEEKRYVSKVKNAQEAHECIRAIDISISPESIRNFLTQEQYDLYQLIWNRTIACQMKDATRIQLSVDFVANDFLCRSSFSKIEDMGFLSFLKYEEGEDTFPNIKNGEKFELISNKILEHQTKPPARYNEATLIKQCEVYGIGRPSTYVPIINTLIKREYIRVNKKALEISFKGLIVYFFLETFFPKYVDLLFTSNVEDILDQIANGKLSFEKETILFINNLDRDTQIVQEKQLPEIMGGIQSLYKTFHSINCLECNNEMTMKMAYSFLLECKNCGNLQKIGEKVDKIGDFEFIETEKYKAIRIEGKNIYMPQNFKGEVTEEVIKFVSSLPKNLYEKEGEQVMCGMSKYGFYLKYLGNYYAFDLDDLITLNTEQIDILLNEKINKKMKGYNQLPKGDIIQTSYGTCEVIITPSHNLLKTSKKIIYLPRNFTKANDITVLNFILSLPKKLYEKNKMPVEAGVGRYGFFLKYNKSYYSFIVDELMNLTIEEIDLLLDKKIKLKSKKKSS